MRTNEAVWLDKYNRWQIKVQKEGIRKTFTSSIKSKKGKIECEKKADAWLSSDVVNTSIRFGKAWEMFIAEKKELTGTANYTNLSCVGRVWLLPALEHKKLSTITPAMLQAIINAGHKKKRSKKTLIDIKGTLSGFHTFCRKQRWLFCGVEFVQIPKGAKCKQKKILQPEQIQAVFHKDTDEFYIHAFRFLILTGLRRGELCGLKNSDIIGSVAYIQRAYNKHNELTEGKTENAVRPMALCTKALEVLQAQKEMLKRRGIISPYVFPGMDGNITNSTSLYRHWWQYRKTIDIDCSLHELRHTLISYASANVPERLLKKSVGHSKSMDTGIYIHAVNDESAMVAALLDERFSSIL